MKSIEYNDEDLQRLFAEMEPKRRVQALKGGFRKEATRVRKTAVNNLRSSGLRTDKDLEKGVRALVFKRKVGFRVTIGTKSKKATKKVKPGYEDVTRTGKPRELVLIWAEDGTKERKTRNNSKRSHWRVRGSHRTGRMKRYGFMAKTLNDVRESVTDNVHNMVKESITRIAKKYGCK